MSKKMEVLSFLKVVRDCYNMERLRYGGHHPYIYLNLDLFMNQSYFDF